MHSGSSAGMCAVRADLAGLVPIRVFSRHLMTIIIVVVLCYMHPRVHFGIKSYAQFALTNKIGILLPFQSTVLDIFFLFFCKGPL